MAISLVVFDFSIIGIGLIAGVVGVRRVLSVSDMIDGDGRCNETFLVERAGDETGYTTPVSFGLGEYGACADGRSLSVILLSAVPALTRAYRGHSRCERVGMLFVWF